MSSTMVLFADLSGWEITGIVAASVLGVMLLVGLLAWYLMGPDLRRYLKIRNM